MIRAYDESYLDSAMNNLGEMLDFAVNACAQDADVFWQLFLSTGFAAQFGSGTPKIVCGRSGTELALEILTLSGAEHTGKKRSAPEPRKDYGLTPEYWAGWILAYYQWYTGRSFKNIYTYVTVQDVLNMYPTLHEASELKFVDTLNRRIRSKSVRTCLKIHRTAAGYSQRELAERSGVSVRMIQKYENRAKDINNAAAETLFSLAKTLGCRIEDLLEPGSDDAEAMNEKDTDL